MDGSHHAWFEQRAPECVIMSYIDDATGRAFARFYDYEGTLPAMDSFKRYARRYGLPIKIYCFRAVNAEVSRTTFGKTNTTMP